jgi:hypothetical protein
MNKIMTILLITLLVFSAASVINSITTQSNNKNMEKTVSFTCSFSYCQCWYVYCANGYKFEFCGTEDALNKIIGERCKAGDALGIQRI